MNCPVCETNLNQAVIDEILLSTIIQSDDIKLFENPDRGISYQFENKYLKCPNCGKRLYIDLEFVLKGFLISYTKNN